MGMENVGLPLLDQLADPRRQRPHLADLAQRRPALGLTHGAEKGQSIYHLFGRPGQRMAQAGDTGHLPPHGDLRLHDGTRAKRVAALRRQAVVEDVQYPCHICG